MSHVCKFRGKFFNFFTLYQMSVALPESSRNVPVYINTSNKVVNRFGKESTASYMEATEVQEGHYDLRKP